MRLGILILILLLGCTPTGIYRVSPNAEYVGVAVSTESLISVMHPPHIGQKLQVFVRGKWIPVKITKLGPKGIIELRGIDKKLDLQPGNSGSPVAVIIARRRIK